MLQDGVSVEMYMQEVGAIPVLTQKEEVGLFRRLESGDESVREQIVRANLRFVVKIAGGFLGQGLPLADLIQEGNIGLLEVIDKFDYHKGFRFSTYASFWIRQAIQTGLRKQRGITRLPVRKSRLLGHINEAVQDFSIKTGREPTTEEISASLEVEEASVKQLMPFRKSYFSLDEPHGEGQASLLDSLPSDGKSPSDVCEEKMLKKQVLQLMNRLDARERKILGLRFGFLTGSGFSLRKASRAMGLSQEGVRRIEKKALAKLRRPAQQARAA